MHYAPIPTNEDVRLCAVIGLKLLDTKAEKRFDVITKKATEIFKVPISTITIVDKDREWYKSKQGMEDAEGPRNISFCGHALMQEDILIIEDTLKNDDFKDNPYVTNKGIRFYAGKSLYAKNSRVPVGVFCIKDYAPRTMSIADINSFLELAKLAEQELNTSASRI